MPYGTGPDQLYVRDYSALCQLQVEICANLLISNRKKKYLYPAKLYTYIIIVLISIQNNSSEGGKLTSTNLNRPQSPTWTDLALHELRPT
jgi:hypothetical protein